MTGTGTGSGSGTGSGDDGGGDDDYYDYDEEGRSGDMCENISPIDLASASKPDVMEYDTAITGSEKKKIESYLQIVPNTYLSQSFPPHPTILHTNTQSRDGGSQRAGPGQVSGSHRRRKVSQPYKQFPSNWMAFPCWVFRCANYRDTVGDSGEKIQNIMKNLATEILRTSVLNEENVIEQGPITIHTIK